MLWDDTIWLWTHESSAPCHLFCKLFWPFLRGMSPLLLYHWSPSKAQACFTMMCQLQSHIWCVTQEPSTIEIMSFKDNWEPHHVHRQYHQACIVVTTWYIQEFFFHQIIDRNAYIHSQHYHRSRKRNIIQYMVCILLSLYVSKPRTIILDPLLRWLHHIPRFFFTTPARNSGEIFTRTTQMSGD